MRWVALRPTEATPHLIAHLSVPSTSSWERPVCIRRRMSGALDPIAQNVHEEPSPVGTKPISD